MSDANFYSLFLCVSVMFIQLTNLNSHHTKLKQPRSNIIESAIMLHGMGQVVVTGCYQRLINY